MSLPNSLRKISEKLFFRKNFFYHLRKLRTSKEVSSNPALIGVLKSLENLTKKQKKLIAPWPKEFVSALHDNVTFAHINRLFKYKEQLGVSDKDFKNLKRMNAERFAETLNRNPLNILRIARLGTKFIKELNSLDELEFRNKVNKISNLENLSVKKQEYVLKDKELAISLIELPVNTLKGFDSLLFPDFEKEMTALKHQISRK